MAPYQMKATSKPKFQPLGGGKVLTGRVEKQGKAMRASHSVLASRPKNDSSITALADRVEQISLVADPSSEIESPRTSEASNTAEAVDDLPMEGENSPFNLQDAIPKSGLRFPGEEKGKRLILGRWQAENRVAEALYADMPVIHKRHAQGVISPIFHQATEMLDQGYMGGLARHEDITQEEGSEMWKRFLGKLWVDSNKKWPHKLSQPQFTKFFSALAEARWTDIYQPKPGGRDPGLLVQHISLFLDAAERAGFPWANGGEVFSDEDEEE